MNFDYDLFVIGGGSGGVRAARIAASEYGAHVGLAEESRMGGTCVIRGCVPKKLMIFASQAGAMAAESRGYGWPEAQSGDFDWPHFHHKLERELDRLSHMAPGTPEIGVSRTYVEWILDLPWGKTTADNLDLKRARKVLDQDAGESLEGAEGGPVDHHRDMGLPVGPRVGEAETHGEVEVDLDGA